jgi:hypothetical protein
MIMALLAAAILVFVAVHPPESRRLSVPSAILDGVILGCLFASVVVSAWRGQRDRAAKLRERCVAGGCLQSCAPARARLPPLFPPCPIVDTLACWFPCPQV